MITFTLRFYYELTVIAGTVVLSVTAKNQATKSFHESTHARGQTGPLFQAMHDYKKSQAINIYVQLY